MKKKLTAIIIGLLLCEIGTAIYATVVDNTRYSGESSGANFTISAFLSEKGLIRYLLEEDYDNIDDGIKAFFQQANTKDGLEANMNEYIQPSGDFKSQVGKSINQDKVKGVFLVVQKTAAQQKTTQAPTGATASGQATSTTPKQSQQQTSANQSTSDKFMAEVEQAIFTKVNQERAKAGVATLSYSTTMEKYSRIKSQDMGDRGYFDHSDPEGNLMTVRLQKDGVTYNAWGENIAYIGGVSDANALANEFMTNWMNSPGHKANILSTNFTGIGVGIYKSGNKVYATQEFIR